MNRPFSKLMLSGCFFFFWNSLTAQLTNDNYKYPPANNWIATCMIGGKNTKHFLLLPEGTVISFAPGGKSEPVEGLRNIVAIAAGNYHMLALKKDGTVWAWGNNDEYQLGNKSLTQSDENILTPVKVDEITNAIGVSAIFNTSFALLADGTIRAWGNGNMGMTGDGKEISYAGTSARVSARRLPVQVQGIRDAVAIAGAMALLANGEVMTWGDGHNGRLGNGTDETTTIPVKVKNIKNAISISSGKDGGLALLANGEVWAWGLNMKGQLGNGATHMSQYDHSSVPVQVKGIKNAIAISADYTCFALSKDSLVMGWGWGEIGALGSRGRELSSIPIKIPAISKAIAIKAGNGFGFALLADGTLMGWGANMVATGVYHQSYVPVKISQVELSR
jgi:alpha-tubulin suppressor-like RCC1 family protein